MSSTPNSKRRSLSALLADQETRVTLTVGCWIIAIALLAIAAFSALRAILLSAMHGIAFLGFGLL